MLPARSDRHFRYTSSGVILIEPTASTAVNNFGISAIAEGAMLPNRQRASTTELPSVLFRTQRQLQIMASSPSATQCRRSAMMWCAPVTPSGLAIAMISSVT